MEKGKVVINESSGVMPSATDRSHMALIADKEPKSKGDSSPKFDDAKDKNEGEKDEKSCLNPFKMISN